jgi:LPS sulfotransferase NodH
LGTNTITYPNILGGSRDYKKFLIVSTPRSGSTFLAGLLRSHPHLVCYNELLLPVRCPFIYSFFPASTDAEVLAIRDRDPVKFLKDFVFRDYLPEFKAVGFKVHYAQLSDPRFTKARKHFLANRDILIVHLIRRNYLRTYLSHRNAKATGQWSQINPALLDGAKKLGIKIPDDASAIKGATEQIWIDPIEVKAYFEQTDLEISQYRSAFRRHQSIPIYYEDLAYDHQSAITPLLSLLGVEQCQLFSIIQKQNSHSLEESITNFSELKRMFQNLKWADFFNE